MPLYAVMGQMVERKTENGRVWTSTTGLTRIEIRAENKAWARDLYLNLCHVLDHGTNRDTEFHISAEEI